LVASSVELGWQKPSEKRRCFPLTWAMMRINTRMSVGWRSIANHMGRQSGYPAGTTAMVKVTKQHDRVKYFKCEVCLKDIAIEYYFTVGDSITCNDCSTEYVLQSKNPLELVRQEPDYSKIEYDDSY